MTRVPVTEEQKKLALRALQYGIKYRVAAKAVGIPLGTLCGLAMKWRDAGLIGYRKEHQPCVKSTSRNP